jgi:hypothetical protein
MPHNHISLRGCSFSDLIKTTMIHLEAMLRNFGKQKLSEVNRFHACALYNIKQCVPTNITNYITVLSFAIFALLSCMFSLESSCSNLYCISQA